jgi:hypothetical protein
VVYRPHAPGIDSRPVDARSFWGRVWSVRAIIVDCVGKSYAFSSMITLLRFVAV